MVVHIPSKKGTSVVRVFDLCGKKVERLGTGMRRGDEQRAIAGIFRLLADPESTEQGKIEKSFESK